MKARYYLLLVCTLLMGTNIFSQGLCPSAALAPVFKQDFGGAISSTARADVPAGFTTNYTFQPTGALNDGFFMLTSRVQNAARNDWAQGGDHTNGTTGNMFLVNAGLNNGIFFTQQVDNLCPGSTYNFSAWLANVNTTSNTLAVCGAGYVYPRVTFRIKNTSNAVLASFNTGNLPLTANTSGPPNWQQYGISFQLPPATTSLILEMVDEYGGASQCGNDLALDDIEFSACTPTASAVFSNSATSLAACTGTNNSISVSLVNSPFTTPAYQWQKSTNGGSTWTNVGTAGTSATSFPLNNITTGDAGLYRVIVGPDVASLSSNTCITASNSVTLTVNESPSVSVGSNSPVCSGNSINLTSSPSGGTAPYTYSWTGPGSFSSTGANPSRANSITAHSGTYSLVVTDNNSCTANGSTSVTVNTTPTVAAISGAGAGCAGSTIALSNATAGGTWSSSHPAIATVDASTGIVSVITAGTFTVTYTVSANGCTASATKMLSAHSVSLPPSVIECNNSTINTQSDGDHTPTYSSSNPADTYLWTITPAVIFKGGTDNTSRYPKIDYNTGSTYNVLLQFTSGGVTCSATQTVYRNGAEGSSTIDGPTTENVCNSTNTINLTASIAGYTNILAWGTSGTGTFSNPNGLTTTYTFSAADKASGQVMIAFTGTTSLGLNGPCGFDNTDTDYKIINISAANTGTNSSSTICSNQIFNHAATSSIAGSTFTWVSSVISGSGSGNATSGSGNIANTLTNLSATTDFVVQYTVTPTSNGCPGTPYTVTVTVKPPPSLTITNNLLSLCTGASTNIQLSDVLSGTQYSWTSAVISGTASGNSNNGTPSATNNINDVLLNTTNLVAVVRYTVTANSTAGCTSTSTTDVTVYPQPTTANAGSDQSLCNVSAATLNGNTASSGTGTWTMVSGPNTPLFTNSSSPATTVTGLVTGTYVFRWSITNNVCAASQDDVTVLVSPVTIAGSLSADATVCATANSGTLTVTGYTGNIINWQTSTDNGATWTTTSITDPVFPYNGLTTTTLFKASVQSGSCSVLFSNTVNITVLQPPTTANAGADQQYNGISASTLAGNDPVEGTGSWTQVSGPNTAIFSDPGLHNSTVSGLIQGIYVFKWTISNGSCGSSEDDMQLEVLPPTVAGTIATDATVCASGGNGGTLTLSGYAGNVLRWQYSTNNGSSWLDITNTTATHIYSNLTTTTLFRAEVQNGTDAPGFSSHVTITVLQPVTVAEAGNAQTLCNLSSATLAGNDPVSGTGTWTLVSGPGGVTFGNPNSYNSSVSGLTTGTYQLRWTISNGGICPSTNDVVDITIAAPTNPGIVAADATVCATSNSGTLSITGFTGGIVQGEFSIDNGANWTVIPTNLTTLPYLNLGITTQFRALVQNSICPAVYSNIVTITVLQPVSTAAAGNDQQLCAAGTATLAANNPSSGTGTWTQVSGPNTATFTNAGAYNTAVNGLITGTYVFRWTISNGSCAPSQDEVTVTVHPATVSGSITGTATVCSGVNSGTLTLTGNTGQIVRWELSTDGGASWNDITNNTSTQNYNNLTATTLYKASVQSGVCLEQYTNNVLITVNPVTVPGTVTGAATVCTGSNNGSVSLSGNNGTVVRWEFSTDGGNTWTNIANTTVTQNFSNLSTTTVYRALVQNGVCADAYSNQVTITVHTATIAGGLSSPATLCFGNNSGTLTLTGNNGSIVRWEYSTDGGNNWNFISNTGNTLNYTNLTTPTDYRSVIRNGVCATAYSNIVSLSINPVTVAGAINGTTTVCTGTNSGTLILSGHTGSVLQWEYSTDGTSWTTISNTTPTQNFTDLNITTQYRALVQSGVCDPAYTTPVSVVVTPVTVPGTLSGAATVCTGSNAGDITLSGHNGNILHWEFSTDGGSNWAVIAFTGAVYSFSNLNTTTLYRAQVQSGVCNPQYSNTITITVNAVSIPGSLLGNTTVCTGSNNGTLTHSGNNGNILRWEYSTDGANWNGIAHIAGTYNFSNLTQETQYRVVVQNGVCAPATSNSVTVLINTNTIPGIVSGNATVCEGNNNGTLTLSGYTGGIAGWESSVDGGSSWAQISLTTDQYTYNNITATTLFRALVKNGVCPSLYSNNGIITTSTPTVSGTISADATVCANGNNGTLQLNGYTGDIVQWESSSNNGGTWSMISNNTNAYTYSDLTSTTLFRAMVKSGVCAPQYAGNVTITVTPLTVPGTVTANATVCVSANSGTLALINNNGSVVQWESSANNGNSWSVISNTGSSHNYSNITETSLFRALVKNGICPSAYSGASTVTVIPPPTIADAGPAQLLCNTSAATLSANTPVNGSGSWTLVSGNTAAVITNTQLPTTTVSGLQTGNYVFAWTISNTICPASAATVSIEVLPALVNNIGVNNITICAGQQVNIQGALATGGNGTYQYQWEMSTDGTLWTAVNGATANDYSFSPAGDVLLRRIAISNNCAVTSAPISVTVQKALANNTITGNQAICDGTGITPITGTLATGGDGRYTYQWEQTSSSSGISINNWNKVENATDPNLPDIKLRTTTSFRRIVTTNLCTGPQALVSNVVTVNVKPLPEISLQYKAGTYCSKDSSIEFISTTNNVDSIKWDFGDGTSQTTGNQKITHRYNKAGVFVPRLLVTSAGNCSVSLAAPDTIRIEEIKPGFRMSGVFDCGKTVYKFVDTSQSYFTIAKRTWLINEVPINSTNREYQHSFGTPGEYDARLKVQSIYGCENTVDARFKVAIYQFPKADINAVNQACRNVLLNLSSNERTIDSIIIRSWDLGNGSYSADSVVSAMYTSTGVYNVKLTVATVNRCYDSALKQLQIHPTPTLQLPAEQVLCKGDSLKLIATGGVNYIWKDDENNIVCNNCPSVMVRPLVNVKYNVIGYSEYGCSEMASTRVRIIPPLTLNAKLLDTLCVGSSKKLIISGADKYSWLPAPGLSNLSSSSPFVTPIATTTYTVIGKDAHDCFADTAQIKIVVGNPTPVTIGKDTVILAGNSIQMRAVSPLPDIRKWRWEGADFSCVNCPTPVARVMNDACINCTVTNQYGCTSSDTLCIKTFCPTTEVFIPNAFTPDGDGINDKLFVQGKGIKMIKSFRVFSRWGELVFEKTNFSPGDPSMGWDGRVRGKLATPDVFVYVCEIICEKGTASTFKGNTAIIK